MKKIFLAIILIIGLAGAVQAGTAARQIDFLLAGYRSPTSDEVLSGGKVKTFLTGTSTLSSLWTDRAKGGTATNPVILDSSGKAEVYGDNIYKFEIYDSDDVLVETISGLYYSDDVAEGADISGDVLSSDLTKVLENGTDGTDAYFIGDIQAADGTEILENGTDGTDAVFTGDLTGDVTGNVTGDLTGDVTGTITATSVLADGVTGTTQAQGDGSTKIATTAYVDTAVDITGSEIFVASGTFSVPAGVEKIFVDAVAGGGGGATGVPPTTGGGGGASGESVYGLILTVTPLADIAVTIGAGGGPAATGGVTSLGSLISLAGGGPGVGAAAGGTSQQSPAFAFNGGAGGNGVNGVDGGASAFYAGGTGGALFGGVEGGGGGGAASCHGVGANGGAGNAAGSSAGANTGAGGGGGGSDNLGQVGGSGGSGYMIIRW